MIIWRLQNIWIFDPLPSLFCIFTQPPLLSFLTASAFGVPPPPPCADIIWTCSPNRWNFLKCQTSHGPGTDPTGSASGSRATTLRPTCAASASWASCTRSSSSPRRSSFPSPWTSTGYHRARHRWFNVKSTRRLYSDLSKLLKKSQAPSFITFSTGWAINMLMFMAVLSTTRSWAILDSNRDAVARMQDACSLGKS